MKKCVLVISLSLMAIFFRQGDAISSEIKKQRIISLAPSTTEILFSLGLDEEIVGVTTFCNFPPEALNKEKIGTFSQPSIEKILLLKPDVIFAAGLEQAFTVERLRELKLKVYVTYPSDIEELFDSIKVIGELTYREKEALILINEMKTKIDRIRIETEVIPQEDKLKVFVEIFYDPLITAGKTSFVDGLIDLAGGINIATDMTRDYGYFSVEEVIRRNPDCIILGHNAKEKEISAIKKRLGWEEISAIKNNRIYGDINPDLFLRPGPRLVKGLEEIYRRLYPR
ncbi:ABC transporter substrate-binding protein [Candidatus Omnitrophota bacterium]